MVTALWATAKAHDPQLLHDGEPSRWSYRVKAIVVFFTHRLWRGGSRLLLQVVICILMIPLLFHMLPTRYRTGYRNVLTWSNAAPREAGPLRIVVFGSQDLAGSSPSVGNSAATWTEQLCLELNCSSFLSFVPPSNALPGLTSNGIYGNELHTIQDHIKTVDITNSPASDYDFLLKYYPIPIQSPDLEAQIQQFLSLPPPRIAPRHTIWIFTFGTWDIWNLAAFPRLSAEHVIDALVSHMFAQIEFLYRKSLNPTSIAFSDFWSNATPSEVDRLADPRPTGKVDERELETFRIVIPELIDITLTPGWQRRPDPPLPHSKAEQMRNADILTKRWNSQVNAELKMWKSKVRSRPEGMDEEGIKEVVGSPRQESLLEYLPASLKKKDNPTRKAGALDGVVYAPYPRRAGLRSNPARALLDAMTEEELQRSGLKDGKGRGTVPVNDTMRFVDVWTPCMTGTVVTGIEPGPGDTVCSVPDDHLFQDFFTVGQRAAKGLARLTAKEIAMDLFPSR